jgi:hypothetical protein
LPSIPTPTFSTIVGCTWSLCVHVGGTRCVTSSTDHYMKRHARITLTVEFIRTRIFLFLFHVQIQWRVWSILTLFSILAEQVAEQVAERASSWHCRRDGRGRPKQRYRESVSLDVVEMFDGSQSLFAGRCSALGDGP